MLTAHLLLSLPLLHIVGSSEWTLLPSQSLRSAADAIGCDLPSLAVEPSLTWDAFQRIHQRKPRAVVLQGLTSGWPARNWTRTSLLERFGNARGRVRVAQLLHDRGNYAPSRSDMVDISDYLNAAASSDVLFENHYSDISHAIREEWTVPALFRQAVHGRPIFSLGHEGSGIGFHNHEVNWLSQVSGRKVWFVLPPAYERPSTSSPCELLLGDPLKDVSVCVVQPSETLFLPEGFWHATCNIDSFNVGLGWEGNTLSWTPVEHAIADENTAMMRADKSWLGQNLPPLLRAAAHTGHIASVEVLFEQGLGVETRDEGVLPLHIATVRGHIPLVRWLIEHRAGVETLDTAKTRAIEFAAFGGHVALTKLLLENRAGVETASSGGQKRPLHVAVSSGHILVIDLLVSHRADVMASTENGTPLHVAASGGEVRLVERLIALRADPATEKEDAKGRRILHMAAHSGYLAVLEFMVKHRADTNMMDSRGFQPLGLAEKAGHHAVVRYLQGVRQTVRRKTSGQNKRASVAQRMHPSEL